MSIRSRLRKFLGNDKICNQFIKEFSQDDWLYHFTDELVKRGVITLRDHHTYWGRFYNFPECCINFYITLLEDGIELPAQWMWENYPESKYDSVSYVQCPKCLKERKIFNETIGRVFI